MMPLSFVMIPSDGLKTDYKMRSEQYLCLTLLMNSIFLLKQTTEGHNSLNSNRTLFASCPSGVNHH